MKSVFLDRGREAKREQALLVEFGSLPTSGMDDAARIDQLTGDVTAWAKRSVFQADFGALSRKLVGAWSAPSRKPLWRTSHRLCISVTGSQARSSVNSCGLYSRFLLRYRDSEDLLPERGVKVSDDAIGLWWRTFEPDLAAGLRRHQRPTAGKWHLDEVQLKINGKKH